MNKMILIAILGVSLAGCKNPFADPFTVEVSGDFNPNAIYSNDAEAIISEIKVTSKVDQIDVGGIFVNNDNCKLIDWKWTGYRLHKGDILTAKANCDPSEVRTVKVYTADGNFEYNFE